MSPMKVEIQTEYIKLDQLLKFSGIAESGSMAKDMIAAENVLVNGQVCTMRGKKLYHGDRIAVLEDDGSIDIVVERS